MFPAFVTGFFLGLSLIVAIGAQNAFVLRQGIVRQHAFLVALFCSISDSLLITFGIFGISYFLNDFISEFSNMIFGLSALWLFSYGIFRLRSATKQSTDIITDNSNPENLSNTITVVAIFTFLNPHVYLDTMILIGSISQQFVDLEKIYFGMGASAASFVWFFCLSYGAKLMNPIMQKTISWRILDLIIAIIMFTISLNLFFKSGWL
jgi:L-lysine exporter family protein LysE/ArgO